MQGERKEVEMSAHLRANPSEDVWKLKMLKKINKDQGNLRLPTSWGRKESREYITGNKNESRMLK